jgi:hypothetical protein
MANIIEGMKVKRMRYFDGLFLTQEEFNLEQNYHIRMRRLHNRHLHTWGIAWGLDVVADGTDKVKITKGMALNNAKGVKDEGNEDEDISQEIVLTEDGSLVLESDDIKKGVYIYLDFEKVENYVVAERGGTEEIHWLENAVIGHNTDINQIKEKLILAKVENSEGEVNQTSIKYFKDDDINKPLRTYAGAYGNLTLPIEKEKPDEEESSDIPTIKGKKINGENGIRIDSPKTEFTGDLNVAGTVDGNLANDIVDTDQIKDNAVTETKLEQAVRDKLAAVVSPELVHEIEDARGIKSTLGNRLDESLTAGGQLRSNVVGMDQLDASIKGKLVTNGDSHDHSGGDGAVIRHSSLNKDDGTNPHGTMASDVGALSLSGGTLSGNLQVNGSYIRISSGSAEANKILEFYESSTLQASLITRGSGIAGGPPSALNIYTAVSGAPITLGTASGEKLRIADNGNVGIGTISPDSKLQVQHDSTHYVGINVSATQAYTTYRNDAHTWKAGLDGYSGNWYMIDADENSLFQINRTGVLNIYCKDVYLRNTYDNMITSGRDLAINSIGLLGYISSSMRHKENIRPLDEYSSKIFRLRPIAFDYKGDAEAVNQFGLIAEEVEKVLPELVSYDKQQNPETVVYSKLVPLILREVIRMKEQNDALNDKIKRIENTLT